MHHMDDMMEIFTGYKTGDLYKSYGDDLYPEFSSLQDDSVLAIKTHTYSEDNTEEVGFKRAVVRLRDIPGSLDCGRRS